MREVERLERLRSELSAEVGKHILPYWIEHTVDHAHGGFVGRITQDGHVVAEADKGCILNARILWTFSAAYRVLRDPVYLCLARRACAYLLDRFRDPEHGGVYWSLDYRGEPVDTRKHVYAQAFALYGLVEHHRATGEAESLDAAVRLFELIERHSLDAERGGYFEAFTRDWRLLDDVRLSEKDLNAPKSMNTHLHVMEAYTNLYRVWPSAVLRERLVALVELFLSELIDPATGQVWMFFTADWKRMADTRSYGHDIETSWLLLEAADVLGDGCLRARAREAALAIARAVGQEGQDADGGLFNELHGGGRLDADKHWWPQAEAVVGFLNAYQESGAAALLESAARAWDFTKAHIVDRTNGEWFWRVTRAGAPVEGEDKVGPWKCPYHNARACLEVMERTERMGVAAGV